MGYYTSVSMTLSFYDVPAGATVTFEITLPGQQWNEAAVAVQFIFADKTAAWRTVGITRQQVEESVTEATAPPPHKK